MDRDDWIVTVLIGGVLTFLGFLIVPMFLVYGYVVRALRATIEGESQPPAFDDWGTLLVDGLKVWLVSVIYMLVPIVVGLVTVGGAMLAMATGDPVGAGAGMVGMFAGMALTFVLALVFGYVAVAAVVNFAHEGRLGAAFDFGRLRGVVFHRDYAVAWLLSILAFVAAGVVAGVPLVGWLLAPFVSFYALVVAARLWAGGYADALEMTDSTTGVETRQSTT